MNYWFCFRNGRRGCPPATTDGDGHFHKYSHMRLNKLHSYLF